MYAHTILRAVMVTDASVHYLLSVPLVNAYPSDSCTPLLVFQKAPLRDGCPPSWPEISVDDTHLLVRRRTKYHLRLGRESESFRAGHAMLRVCSAPLLEATRADVARNEDLD